MKTWLLMAIAPVDRLYQGHEGYDDDLRTVYRFDSFVPNHRKISVGDVVILRDKRSVRGCGIIETVDKQIGTKLRRLCPQCGASKIKERRHQLPRFRCECGAEFETPKEKKESCTLYAAHFGSSFQHLTGEISVAELWELAPRLNKQLAMLELDGDRAASKLARTTSILGRADEPTVAAKGVYKEGQRTTVLVNRYERDPQVRKICIDHYGPKCSACGFSFAKRYGSIGRGVIEVHHLEPLGSGGASRNVDPIEDLRPLCSNCHTIIHQIAPALTMDELKQALKEGVV